MNAIEPAAAKSVRLENRFIDSPIRSRYVHAVPSSWRHPRSQPAWTDLLIFLREDSCTSTPLTAEVDDLEHDPILTFLQLQVDQIVVDVYGAY